MEAQKKKAIIPNMINEEHKGVKITTPIFRLSYPNLSTPRAYKGVGKKYFSIEMLFDKKSAELKSLKKQVEQAAIDAFGEDKKSWPQITWPVYDGDEKMDSIGYAGTDYFRAKTEETKRMMLFKRDKTVAVESDFYGGAYCDAVVTAKASYVKGEHFVTLYLNAIRFIKAGTPFGGGVSAGDFADIPDDEGTDESSEEEATDKFW